MNDAFHFLIFYLPVRSTGHQLVYMINRGPQFDVAKGITTQITSEKPIFSSILLSIDCPDIALFICLIQIECDWGVREKKAKQKFAETLAELTRKTPHAHSKFDLEAGGIPDAHLTVVRKLMIWRS